MSVAYQELSGSPVETYDADGFRARRELLVAWGDRDALAADLLGQAREHGNRTRLAYPGKSAVFAARVRFEPLDPASPDVQALGELTEGLNNYTGWLAKAVVEYETSSPNDLPDGPDSEPGTHLTYRMVFASQSEPLAAAGWTWADDPATSLPDDFALAKTISTTEHHLTWHQVVKPPWAKIRELQGTINAAEFLDCAAGTLLFEGAEANKLFRSGFDAGASEFCWQIRYLFRERAVKHRGQVYGWNHVFRPDPPGWVEVTAAGAGLYDQADFTPLFESAEGD